MRSFPLCEDPLNRHGNRPETAIEVHHIIPLVRDPRLAFNRENCAALCQTCHAIIEKKERAGISTQYLFKRPGGCKSPGPKGAPPDA